MTKEKKRPRVFINAAMTLDGKVALSNGDRLRISCEEDKARVHRLRAACDAVLVGVNTVIKDDPKLYVNEKYTGNPAEPLRVVLDSSLRTPKTARIVSPLPDGRWPPTVIFTSREAEDRKYNLRTAIERVGRGVDGYLDIEGVLHILHSRYGVKKLLVEGGPTVLKTFILSGLYDEFTLYIGPMMVGDAPALIRGWECFNEKDVPRFTIKSAMKLGEGVMLVVSRK